jgi:hypothetical protein
MLIEKKNLQASYPFIALFLALITCAWMIESVVASSAKLDASATQDSAQLMSTTSLTGAFLPVLKADNNGRLLLAYNHNTSTFENPSFNPYYRKSTNGGKNWSAPAPIQLGSDNMLEVTFAFDNNNVAHAVWRTQYELWHAPENGWPSSANSHQIVPNTGEFVFSPDIAVSPDNTLHVVWAQDNKILHSYSKDSGENWSTPFSLSPGGDLKSDVPDVEVDYQGNVHIVWEERIITLSSIKHEIHYIKGTVSSQGISWSSNYSLLSPGIAVAKVPAMNIDGNIIHVAFSERRTEATKTNQYAYYVNATLNSNWSSPLDITQGDPFVLNTNIPFVLLPSVDSCNQKLYVYFHGAIEKNQIEKILRVDSGDNWSKRVDVTGDGIRAIRPSLTCIGGMLHVAYEQINTMNENHQIYYIAGMAYTVYIPTLRTK